MLSANKITPENIDIFRQIADGNFDAALHQAQQALHAAPKDKVLIHAFARLDEIQTTIPFPDDHDKQFPPPENIAESPAFVQYQAEVQAAMGNPRASLMKLDSLMRKMQRVQGLPLQIAHIHGSLTPDDDAIYDNLLDATTHVHRNDLDDILGNFWLLDQESPFTTVAEGEKGCIFASSATHLPFAHGGIACWIPHLPEDGYLILTDWGPTSDLPGGYWRALIPESVRTRVYFLSNEQKTHDTRLAAGLNSTLVSNNCWLDENRFQIMEKTTKDYDAIYTARAVDVKRVHLAENVKNLALVCSDPMTCGVFLPSVGFERCAPSHRPDTYLSHLALTKLYNRSHCGLMLSRFEGACYTVSEYMLCGIPVVSTEPEPGGTLGGRQAWLSPDNSLYCEPTPASVADAVAQVMDMSFIPEDIRDSQISRITDYRSTFEDNVFQPLLHRIGYRGDTTNALRDILWQESEQKWGFRMENTMAPLKEILGNFHPGRC